MLYILYICYIYIIYMLYMYIIHIYIYIYINIYVCLMFCQSIENVKPKTFATNGQVKVDVYESSF